MLHLQRQNVVVCLEVILAGKPVVAMLDRPRSHRVVEPWQPIIRRVVFLQMNVVQRRRRLRIQPDRQRWRNAPAADLGERTARHAALLCHRIQANRAPAQHTQHRSIQVGSNSARRVSAKHRLHLRETLHRRHLALLVHHAAGRPPPELNPRRPLQRLHLFVVERVAVVAAEVPDPVEKNIVPRRKPANRQVVSLRSGFTGRQADSRHVAQRIPQRRHSFVLHDKLRYHGDALRRRQQRLGKLRQRNRIHNRIGYRYRVLRLHPHHHRRGILHAIVQPRAVQKQAQRLVLAIQPQHSGRVEPRQRPRRQHNLHRQPGSPLVGLDRSVQRARGDIEPLQRQRRLRRTRPRRIALLLLRQRRLRSPHHRIRRQRSRRDPPARPAERRPSRALLPARHRPSRHVPHTFSSKQVFPSVQLPQAKGASASKHASSLTANLRSLA